jgi:transcriptional regulator with XRE-family HTH domain
MLHIWVEKAKRIMKERKITQIDITHVMGKNTRGAVGHYFTGRSNPTIDQLDNLANYLSVPVGWLVSKDDTEFVGIDHTLLKKCIELVDESEGRTGVYLNSNKKAQLMSHLYMKEKNGDKINLNTTTELLELIRS